MGVTTRIGGRIIFMKIYYNLRVTKEEATLKNFHASEVYLGSLFNNFRMVRGKNYVIWPV